MITYRSFGTECMHDVYAIAGREGWTLYADSCQMTRAFKRSLYVLGAFDQDRLVGWIRCVGDGEYEVYVSDLIVMPEYRRQHIGKTLLSIAMEKFKGADTFGLMTGLHEKGNLDFYAAMGMCPYAEKGLIGFLRPSSLAC